MRARARPDRRTQRTRQKLLRTFAELVLTRGFVELSATDIAASAGVGRSTLYTHFAGPLKLLEASLERPCRTLAAAVCPTSCPRDLLPLLEHFRSQAHRVEAFFQEPIYLLWTGCLEREIAAALRRDPSRARHRPSLPREWLAPVLAQLQLAILRRWLAEPAAASPESVATTLSTSSQRLIVG
jgi:AcrR family transcriptional regulator